MPQVTLRPGTDPTSINCGANGSVVSNATGGGTVFYKDSYPMGVSDFEGTIVAGSSTTLYGTVFAVADGRADCTVVELPVLVGSTGDAVRARTALDVAIGATTVTANAGTPAVGTMVAIDAYSASCELRTITAVSGQTLTVAALKLAHAAGARLIFFDDAQVPPAWFGAVGNNVVDDEPAVQAALNALSTGGLLQQFNASLHGQGLFYRLAAPLMLPNHSGLRALNLTMHSSYAPEDSKGGMCMTFRGTAQAFTATASTDVITTPVAHGVSTSSQVVFKGTVATLAAAGITAGKVYYVKTVPTATTFTVSATSGGVTLDVTADVAGTVYPDPQALCRLYLDGVTLNGGSLGTARNGLRTNLQQPSSIKDFRFDNFTGMGYVLSGQQAAHFNVEGIGCGVGLAFDGASFGDFVGVLDLEQNGTQLKVLTAAESLFGLGGGANVINVSLLHMEATGAQVGIDLAGPHTQINFTEVHWTQPGTGAMLWQHYSDLISSGYRLGNIRAIVTAGTNTIVNDVGRGITRTNIAVGTYHCELIEASPSFSDTGFVDESRHEIIGPAGGHIRWGGVNTGAARLALRPDTGQTAPQIVARNVSGVDKSGVSVGGFFYTQANAAPADADIASNQVFWWFDSTAAAPQINFKGKDSAGTVFTKQVAASSGGGGTSRKRLISGSYYGPLGYADAAGGVFALDDLVLVPFEVPVSTTFDRIGINVFGASTAGVVARLAIYLDNGVTGPNALILDAGTVATDVATRKELTISSTLAAGLYWIGIASQVAGASRGNIARVQNPQIVHGFAAPQGFNSNFTAQPTGAFRRAGISGALPATLTPLRADMESSLDTPFVWMRAA